MLDLNDLTTGNIPAVTPALGGALAEAAGICLESQRHTPGVFLQLIGISGDRYALMWPVITEQALKAWNETEKATQWGAEGIAVLLADRLLPYTPIEASRRGTGFDYGMVSQSDDSFQPKARLEVSGIRNGNDGDVRRRVREKLAQIGQSDNLGMVGYVIVVEFSRPIAEVWEK